MNSQIPRFFCFFSHNEMSLKDQQLLGPFSFQYNVPYTITELFPTTYISWTALSILKFCLFNYLFIVCFSAPVSGQLFSTSLRYFLHIFPLYFFPPPKIFVVHRFLFMVNGVCINFWFIFSLEHSPLGVGRVEKEWKKKN